LRPNVKNAGRKRQPYRREALGRFASDQKPRERRVWKTTKPAFPALGAPTSSAWVHGRPRVEELTLPKFVECGNLSLTNAVIRRMSGQIPF
jgi:hypothetical protein